MGIAFLIGEASPIRDAALLHQVSYLLLTPSSPFLYSRTFPSPLQNGESEAAQKISELRTFLNPADLIRPHPPIPRFREADFQDGSFQLREDGSGNESLRSRSPCKESGT